MTSSWVLQRETAVVVHHKGHKCLPEVGLERCLYAARCIYPRVPLIGQPKGLMDTCVLERDGSLSPASPKRHKSLMSGAVGERFVSMGCAAVVNSTHLEQEQKERRSACHQDASQRLFVQSPLLHKTNRQTAELL